MRLRRVPAAFDDPDYLFELKHDGFRALAYLQDGECKLISRRQNTLAFRSLKNNLANLSVGSAIIDGEVVCLDSHGKSRFDELLSLKAQPILYAFDLLWLNGEDLRQQPLIDRKNRLHDLICAHQHMRLIYAQHIEGKGREFFREACARDLEGIVAKRKNSVYRDDGTGWLKIKNPRYSQAEGRHELWTRRK
jgi:bifunctional non-homologous end joining protein LigD